jgi:transcriptional/translational regulatory protein YebC/TACO1
VAYLFNKQGSILLSPDQSEDEAMEIAIEAGALDVLVEDGQIEVITEVETYQNVLQSLQQANCKIDQSELTMRADTMIAVDNDAAESLMKLIDTLEDLDDVQDVYCNAEFPESLCETA